MLVKRRRDDEKTKAQELEQAAARHAKAKADALALLQAPKPPRDLNRNLDERYRMVFNLLHLAMHEGLPDIAVGILARPEFEGVNDKIRELPHTVLHWAAGRGFQAVCQAIVARKDFTELIARNQDGRTAAEVASCWGHDTIADFLHMAEVEQGRNTMARGWWFWPWAGE